MEYQEIIITILMGISLAACAGLRAFLPLLVVSVAAKTGLIQLGSGFEWLSSWPSIIVFSVAVLFEILGDKIPAVDHFLDVFGTFVKPVAGTIAVASTFFDLSPLHATFYGIIFGGTVAEGVHLVKAKARIVSTATTAGFGNPLLSIAEDAASLSGSIMAIFIPVLIFIIIVLTFYLFWLAYRKLRRRKRVSAPNA